MGLSVVLGIVKGYGCMITAKSTRGRGTTFTVSFPKSEEQIKVEYEETSPLPIGKERILVVDDEESMADMT
jgi:two-component system cell cycle sensor histidine kinase/response regulator CckA